MFIVACPALTQALVPQTCYSNIGPSTSLLIKQSQHLLRSLISNCFQLQAHRFILQPDTTWLHQQFVPFWLHLSLWKWLRSLTDWRQSWAQASTVTAVRMFPLTGELSAHEDHTHTGTQTPDPFFKLLNHPAATARDTSTTSQKSK